MALLPPAATPSDEPASDGNGRIAAMLREQLDEDWRIFRDCIVTAGGEAGRFDYVLLHAERGIALLAIVEPGEEIDAESAVAAMRTMLREGGFAALFATLPAIAALAVDPADCETLGARLARALDGTAARPSDADWPDWVAGRMAAKPEPAQREVPPPAAGPANTMPQPPASPPRSARPRLRRRDLALSASVALIAAALGVAAVAGAVWPSAGMRGATPATIVALPVAAPPLPVAAHRAEVAAAPGAGADSPLSLDAAAPSAARDRRVPATHPARHRKSPASRPVWDRLTALFR